MEGNVCGFLSCKHPNSSERIEDCYTQITYLNPEWLCLKIDHTKSYQSKGCSFYTILIGKQIYMLYTMHIFVLFPSHCIGFIYFFPVPVKLVIELIVHSRLTCHISLLKV